MARVPSVTADRAIWIKNQVRLIEVWPDDALLLGSLDQGGHQRSDAIAGFVGPRGAELRVVHDLGEAAVAELHVQ